MSAIAAVCAWLQTNLPVKQVFQETSEVMEDLCPAAMVMYDGQQAADTLDAGLRQEKYRVALLAPQVGAEEAQMADELSAMEEALVDASRSSARSDAAWSHLTVAAIGAERGVGASLWQLTVYVN